MSLKSFLQNIWEHIKDLFHKIEPKAKDAIAIGVKVVDNIKLAFDSGIIDTLEKVIPGDIDDKIIEKIRAALPQIVTELQLASNCANETDPVKIVQCAIDTLKGLAGTNAQKDFFDSLAVEIAVVAADGELTWDDGKTIAKWYNDHVKNS
jgi:uncharacterized protein YjaG (DUF416 family)